MNSDQVVFLAENLHLLVLSAIGYVFVFDRYFAFMFCLHFKSNCLIIPLLTLPFEFPFIISASLSRTTKMKLKAVSFKDLSDYQLTDIGNAS